MENWDIAWLYFKPSDLCRARLSMRCMGGGFRGGGEGTLHLIETQPSIHIRTSETNWTRSKSDARPTARRTRRRCGPAEPSPRPEARGPRPGARGPGPESSRGFTARPENRTAVANSEKAERNLRYLLKRTLCSFSYPHFYISKLRVSVCICETSPTLNPQRRGRARSLQPPRVILKNTYMIGKRAHSRDLLPPTPDDVSIILFVSWAVESIKSEKCCTVYTQTRWLLLVGII